MQRKFKLNEVSQLSHQSINIYKDEKGIYSVQPSGDTSENLNQDDVLDFQATLGNKQYDVFDSNLFFEGVLQQKVKTAADNTWAPITDNVTLESNAFTKLYNEIKLLDINGTEIDGTIMPGEVSSLNNFQMRDYNYPNTDGQLSFFIPDTGKGDHTNSEFLKRKNILGTKFQVQIQLNTQLGFLAYVRVVMAHTQLTLRIQRNFMSEQARKQLFYGEANALNEYRIRLK